MEIEAVPAALRERLGPDAAEGLLEVLEYAHAEGRADVIAACTDMFDRRLVKELADMRVQIAEAEASLRQELVNTAADIRVEMAQMGAGIREDMAQMGAGIREDMARMGASIREDMARMGASIREDMARMGASIREDMSSGRVEFLKWCFLFWIGQVVAVTTVVGVMLRLVR